MTEPLRRSRRRFLKEAAAAAAGVGLIEMRAQAEARATSMGRPVWTVACRDAHLRQSGKPDCWQAMSAIGVEGVEASVTLEGRCPGLFGAGFDYAVATPEGVKALAAALAREKKKISAFCLHNHFDERADEELKCIRMTTAAAVELGVPAIRLDIVPRQIKDEDAFAAFAIGMGRRILDETKDAPVRFGVENHGGTTNKPEFLKRLFEGVGSNRFGLTLDTANFYWFGHPLSRLYTIYEEFAPYACHTHCKSINYPAAEREKQRQRGWEYDKYCCPITEGDIDFSRVAAILAKAGYKGDLCIENESLGRFDEAERGPVLAREAALLRQLARQAASRPA